MNRLFYPLLISFLVFFDVLFFSLSSDIRTFLIIFIHVVFIKFIKLRSVTTFVLSLIFLTVAYVQFIFLDPVIFINPSFSPSTAERLSIWAFLFFLIGFFQQLISHIVGSKYP